jgi:hypothetical protein
MSIEEFISKWDGKFCEVGGSSAAINQCVDLANAYLDEVLGEPMVFGADAVSFWDRTNLIQIKPNTYPQKGDIVIWNTNVGSHGHIAVATGLLNGNKFQTFSQNWPLKSPCHMQDYNLNNLIGYLRKDTMTEQGIKNALTYQRERNNLSTTDGGLEADVKSVLAGNDNTMADILKSYSKAGDLIHKSECPKCPAPIVCPDLSNYILKSESDARIDAQIVKDKETCEEAIKNNYGKGCRPALEDAGLQELAGMFFRKLISK